MIIKESKGYKRDKKRKLIDKHKTKELERLENITSFIESKNTMKDVLDDNISRIYNIRQKHNNLKEIFTANLNDKLRLYMKPIGEYPYNLLEITEIEFDEIDDHHYGEG